MTKKIVLLDTIKQKNNYTFSIKWTDGTTDDFRLCELQRNCPCAGCVDESTGRRLSHLDAVPDHLTAIKIENVGRYALKIHFASGCSRGIYSFDFLRLLNRRLVPK
jgi:ATP-binding protein involved in chromosome partitioning